MKIYISADMEGVTGANVWDEVDRSHNDYPRFVEQMTAEVNAACEAAYSAGATEIVVQDAHWSARNLRHTDLPKGVKLIRGWSGHPNQMVQELDTTFDAVFMIGYHSPAGADTNTLAHTMSGRSAEILLNGKRCSEFLLHSILGSTLGVPTVFVSGDAGLSDHIHSFNSNITTVVTGRAVGDSTIAEHPKSVLQSIQDGVKTALAKDVRKCLLDTANEYVLEVEYRTYHPVYKASFFPGVERVADRKVRFVTKDYFEVMRTMLFIA